MKSLYIGLHSDRSILLGVGSNTSLNDVELDLSSNALGSSAAACQMLEACLPNVGNITSLDISDNGWSPSSVLYKKLFYLLIYLFMCIFILIKGLGLTKYDTHNQNKWRSLATGNRPTLPQCGNECVIFLWVAFSWRWTLKMTHRSHLLAFWLRAVIICSKSACTWTCTLTHFSLTFKVTRMRWGVSLNKKCCGDKGVMVTTTGAIT